MQNSVKSWVYLIAILIGANALELVRILRHWQQPTSPFTSVEIVLGTRFVFTIWFSALQLSHKLEQIQDVPLRRQLMTYAGRMGISGLFCLAIALRYIR
jgi:hypothetical protein